LAAKEVAHAAPDGYTLLSVFHHFVIFPAISASSPYSIHDFEPIAKLAVGESVISGNPKSPWKTYDEVIEYARKNPRKLKVATSGIASMGNFMQEIVNKKAKIEYIHMPLNGEIDALPDSACFLFCETSFPHLG
jgi:tripartite-type tricarboxylate transporter receptor subunit TctC